MKILHGADFHLDSAFAALPPEKAKERRQEARELLFRISALANDRGAELMLLSGDLFDSCEVYSETIEAMEQMLGETRCPVLIAPGNHDPLDSKSPYHRMKLPKNVYLFKSPEMEAVKVRGCYVYGCAFTSQSRLDSPLRGFSVPKDGNLHLMCLHADVNPGSYAPITRQEIAASGLTYLALGHIHAYDGIHREGDTFYAYPGCPEGRGFDETGEKGVLLLDAVPGRVTGELVPLASRRYESLPVYLSGDSGEAAVATALAPFTRRDAVRLVLRGYGDGVDAAKLQAQFQDRVETLEITDESGSLSELWERAGEDSLRGLFLASLQEKLAAASTPRERETILLAARFGTAALDHREI